MRYLFFVIQLVFTCYLFYFLFQLQRMRAEQRKYVVRADTRWRDVIFFPLEIMILPGAVATWLLVNYVKRTAKSPGWEKVRQSGKVFLLSDFRYRSPNGLIEPTIVMGWCIVSVALMVVELLCIHYKVIT